jgi:predicted transposase/invertase (TIGR01784 family)
MISPEAKPFLMKLITGLIGRNIADVTVHSNELPISDTEEKGERFDVNCKTDDGSQVNIEMQASRMSEDSGGEHKNLKGRSVYFLCDLHSSQPAKGQLRYDKLARSYQVTICSYPVFPHREKYVNSFSMRHDEDSELLHNAIQAVIVELSKLEEVVNKPVEAMTDLEKFAIFLEYADNPTYRDTVNKVIESEEVLTLASDLLMNISQDEKERAIFRSRKKFRMDHESDMATAEDRGRASIVRNLKNVGNLSIADIAKLTGLSTTEIERLS